MDRKALAWLWLGIGLVAIVLVVSARAGRRPRLELTAMPSATQPIIVEPIQPSPVRHPPGWDAMSNGASPSAAVPMPVSPTSVMPAAPVGEAAPPAATAMPLPAEGAERVRAIQQALHAAGYDPGPVDGKLGRRTQQAIRQFQEAHGLSVDGKVGPKTWAKLEPYLRGSFAARAE